MERVPAPHRTCWMCGAPAVCGQKPPGRGKARALCHAHADAVFGQADPAWRRLDATSLRKITEDWLRGMTILAHPQGHSVEELLAEIAKVNDVRADQLRIASSLLPGEAHDVTETIRATNRIRSRETGVHAHVTQILLGWLAEATGKTPSEILQRLALTLETWLADQDPPEN